MKLYSLKIFDCGADDDDDFDTPYPVLLNY